MNERFTIGYVNVRDEQRKDLTVGLTFNGYTSEEAKYIKNALQNCLAQAVQTLDEKGETNHG